MAPAPPVDVGRGLGPPRVVVIVHLRGRLHAIAVPPPRLSCVNVFGQVAASAVLQVFLHSPCAHQVRLVVLDDVVVLDVLEADLVVADGEGVLVGGPHGGRDLAVQRLHGLLRVVLVHLGHF